MAISEETWKATSLELIRNPFDFRLHEKFISIAENFGKRSVNKVSSDEEKDVLKISYENLLHNFPLLTNYWIRYAECMYRLSDFEAVEIIYNKALIHLKYSIDIWTNYLQFKVNTITDNVANILELFEEARNKIGNDFYSYEFYKLYLQFLESYDNEENDFKKKYRVLLRIVLEIPIYHYDYFFSLAFKRINHTDGIFTNLFPKKSIGGGINQDSKSNLTRVKRILTDMYITTQFEVYQLYEFERKIHRHFFDPECLSSQEVGLFTSYLDFVELNYPWEFVTIIFERCILPTAKHSQIWIRYIDLLLSKKMFADAREILKRSIRFCQCPELITKLSDIELYFGNYLNARDIIVNAIQFNSSVSISIYCKLISIEHLIYKDDEEYLVDLITEIIKETKNDLVFKELSIYSISKELKLKIFETFAMDFKNSECYNHAYLHIVGGDLNLADDFPNFYDYSLQPYVPQVKSS